MTTPCRRTFVVQLIAASSCFTAADAFAQSAAALDESNPQAAAMGYKRDTTKVDAAKYPKHINTQSCATCQLYQGKAGQPTGGCPIFPGKQVASTGWCSSWIKKA